MTPKNSSNKFRAGKNSVSREPEMIISDQSREMNFVPDPFAFSVLLDSKPDWIPMGLFFDITDSLRGFTEDMALLIIDDLIDCWNGLGMHVTGYKHIDNILGEFYARILTCAFKKGVIWKR